MSKNPIKVTCAIIFHQHKVLATRRSKSMNMPLKWEFPGGKLEPGEDEAIGLIREIKEELGIEIKILKRLPENIHHYHQLTICLIPFVASYDSGQIKLTEHDHFLWLDPLNLPELDWAEADWPLVKLLPDLAKQTSDWA